MNFYLHFQENKTDFRNLARSRGQIYFHRLPCPFHKNSLMPRSRSPGFWRLGGGGGRWAAQCWGMCSNQNPRHVQPAQLPGLSSEEAGPNGPDSFWSQQQNSNWRSGFNQGPKYTPTYVLITQVYAGTRDWTWVLPGLRYENLVYHHCILPQPGFLCF